jgi:hypothetical protein
MAQDSEAPESALSEEKPEQTPTPSEGGEAPPPEQQVKYSMSPGLLNFLGSNKIGLAISSYQSGKFYLLGQNKDGGLLVDERFFRKAMGICVPDHDTLLLATLFQIIKFKNVLEPDQEVNNVFHTCYVPRELYVTGELDAHDVGQLKDGRIDLDTGACVHWFRIDGAIGELYDVAVVPGIMRGMSLSFASNEVLGSSPTTRSPRSRPSRTAGLSGLPRQVSRLLLTTLGGLPGKPLRADILSPPRSHPIRQAKNAHARSFDLC